MDILENSTMLIAIAGDGRSYSLMAIDEAQKGNFEKADEYLKKADESLKISMKRCRILCLSILTARR